MHQLTNLNTYCNNVDYYELCFKEILSESPIKNVFMIFLQSVNSIENTNNFHIPLDIKKIILGTIIDLKFQDVNFKVLKLSAEIYSKFMNILDCLHLNEIDCLTEKCTIHPTLKYEFNQTNLCFELGENASFDLDEDFEITRSEIIVKDAKDLFPFKTRIAIAYVEDVISASWKNQRVVKYLGVVNDQIPFSEASKGIPLPQIS